MPPTAQARSIALQPNQNYGWLPLSSYPNRADEAAPSQLAALSGEAIIVGSLELELPRLPSLLVDKYARWALGVGIFIAGMHPKVGIPLDLAVIASPETTRVEKGFAIASLGLNILTLGLASSYGAFRMAARGRGFTGAGLRSVDDWAEATYHYIRTLKRRDIATVAKNTGLSPDEVLTLKRHLFYGKHRLPAEGGMTWYRARFTAYAEIAYAWQMALKGELTSAQQQWFRQLANHELAERTHMAIGIPYRNPQSWNPEFEMWDLFPPGAHDLAPPPPKYGEFPGFGDWFDNFFR